jgi:hypothetical protein
VRREGSAAEIIRAGAGRPDSGVRSFAVPLKANLNLLVGVRCAQEPTLLVRSSSAAAAFFMSTSPSVRPTDSTNRSVGLRSPRRPMATTQGTRRRDTHAHRAVTKRERQIDVDGRKPSLSRERRGKRCSIALPSLRSRRTAHRRPVGGLTTWIDRGSP